MVSGVLLSSHGFLGILLNFSLIELMNPNNEKANVYVKEGSIMQEYFSKDVYKHFPHAMRTFGF
jgi:hypothetical protein